MSRKKKIRPRKNARTPGTSATALGREQHEAHAAIGVNAEPVHRWYRRPGFAVAIVLLAMLAAGGVFVATRDRAPVVASSAPVTSTVVAAKYVTSAQCAGCHAKEHAAWKGSDHDLAMQTADAQSVLGDFAGAKFNYAGTTSTFIRRDGKFFVNTDGPDGKLADFEIKYTFGVRPLQQYLIELPGGRMQALGIAWDSRSKAKGGQRWFHLYPGQSIKAGDPLHWTGVQQNWNFQCAECHSTDFRKSFDAAAGAFKSTWAEMNVACEACHGPGSNHVAWARKEGAWQSLERSKGLAIALDERRGVSWMPVAETGNAKRSAPRQESREIDTCARCHARASRISDDYVHGKPPAGHAPARAARRQPLLERRSDARRGLQLGLVRAKPHARAGRDLRRLPRSALAQAPRSRQRRLRPVPSAGEIRCPRSIRTTPEARPAPRALRATCRRRRTWSSTRVTTTLCAFRGPTFP